MNDSRERLCDFYSASRLVVSKHCSHKERPMSRPGTACLKRVVLLCSKT